MAKKVAQAPEVRSDGSASAPKKPRETGKEASGARRTQRTPALLTLTDIGDHLAATFDLPKSHAKIYLAEAVALVGEALRSGDKVRISGLGVFQVRKRAARKGRNPKTGDPMKIKASKRVAFAAARDLRSKL